MRSQAFNLLGLALIVKAAPEVANRRQNANDPLQKRSAAVRKPIC
jgi:hypothetical protein